MIILGIVLVILGVLLKVSLLTTLGIIALVVGLALLVLGSIGKPIGGRAHYY